MITDSVSREGYEAINALNFSALKHMRRSPQSYKWHLTHPKEQTPAMRLGSLSHVAILEPDRANSEFVVWHGGRRYGKKWDAFVIENAARTILAEDEMACCNGMQRAVRSSTLAARYFESERSEVTMVWEDEVTHRRMKGRIDTPPVIDGRPTIVDLKTCRDCQPWAFERAAYALGYHIQVGIYEDGYWTVTGNNPDVVIVAVEQMPPHEVAVYRVPPMVLQQGIDDARRLIRRLEECERADLWPPANTDELELSLPAWAIGDVETGNNYGVVEIER